MTDTSLFTLPLLSPTPKDAFDPSFSKLIGPGLSCLGSDNSESSLTPLPEITLLE